MKTFTSFIRNGFLFTIFFLLTTNAGITGGSSAIINSLAPQLCSSSAVAVAEFHDPEGDMNPQNATGDSDEDYASIGYNEYITLDLTGNTLPAGSSATIRWRKDSGINSPYVYLYESTDDMVWKAIEVNVDVTNDTFSGYTVSISEGMRYLTIRNASVFWVHVESIMTTYPCPDCTDGALTLDTGNNEQSVCQDAEISNIVYTVGGGATGAGVTGLPDGVTGNYDSGTFTISGTPIVSGTFGYTVTTTGTVSPCVEATAEGTITVTAPPTAPGINVQNNCGTSTLTATGYSGTLLWSTGETTASINVTSNGTYTVTQTVGGCTSIPGETTVAIIASPVATPPVLGDGSSGNPYRIATLENLYWIAANSVVWDKHFIQTANIDASETAGWCTGGWLPIGNFWVNDHTGIRVFSGSYDGQGHTISGLYIANSTSVAFGFFGRAVGATIKNLGLISVEVFDVSGDAGALVGSAKGCSIDNCYSTGSITVSFSGLLYNAGGMVGSQETNSVVSNCYSTCNVAGDGRIGGLVGWNTNYSTITNSFHATGTVNGSASTMSSTGGLVGENYFYSSIEKCYSTGTVTGFDYTGGLVGINTTNASVSNCFSRGDVSSHSSFGYNSGGLVGYNYLNSTITNCFSTGLVVAHIGGLLGYQSDGATTVNSYWDTQASGTTFSFGGTGQTTAEMQTQSTFVDWDFATIWGINAGNNDGYPYLLPTSVCTNGSLEPLTSNNVQSVCQGTALNNIVYTVGGGASGAGVTGLPAGVSGNFSSGAFTISGTPTVAGTFNYTVSTTGTESPCSEATVTGTITVTAPPTAPGIIVQNNCGNSTLTATGYTGTLLWSTGATSASITVTSGGIYTVTQTVGGCTSAPGETTVVVSLSPVATAPSSGDGSSGNPYRIATLENLYWIAVNSGTWNKHFIQTADIDASETAGWCTGGWLPIGDDLYNSLRMFSGNYNGQGHTISGLHIADNSLYLTYGLFGAIKWATIQNLGIINIEINDVNGLAGAIAGYAEGATINHCYSSGNIAVNNSGSNSYDAGGLVGAQYLNSTISDSYSSCNVSANNTAGGLVGYNYTSSILNSFFVTGTVTGNGITSYTGGVVGHNTQNASINKCYSAGTVIGYDQTGGLVGMNSSNSLISNCYSRSNCTFNAASPTYGGGLVGGNIAQSTITNCYSTGYVGTSRGGLLGYGFNNSVVLNSFWDTESSGTTWSHQGTGKTTAEMKTQSTFIDWDFATIWGINAGNNDGYPYLVPASICTNGTIVLTSASGSDNQTVCANTAITPIVYTISGGATGAEVSDLPDGVSANFSGGTLTISGTSAAAGSFNYTVTTTGTASPCTEATATGTITVSAIPAAPVITAQNYCGYTTLTATGYTGSLLWSTEETTASINVTTGGTYTVTQTVDGCTSTPGETTVVVAASPVAMPPVLGDGSSGNPYRIATLENLYWIAAGNDVVANPTQSQRFAAHYIQSADIDASATSEWCSGGWVPIGYLDTSYKEHPFSGTYDGGGFTISGLTINRPSEIWFQGLFGLVNGGTIKNLGLVNVDIIAGFNAGGLAGRVRFATVINCFTTGSVAGTATEYGYSNGGLVGNMMQSSLSECYSTCEVSGSTFVGGLIGHIELSIVTRCHSTGAVSHSSTRTGAATGGLVGWSAGTSFSTCYSTGNVFASGDASSGNNTGGFVGSNRNYYISPHTPSSITDCYSTGNVSGSYNTGGFAGHNGSASGILCTITNSYSRGEISGGGTLAGFVAENTGTISSCFFDADLDGISYTSSGTVNAGAIGKSSEEMKVQSTFVGWDFTTIWGLDAANNEGYPYFLPAPICIDGTIALAIASGPETQTVCAGTAITPIIFTIGGGATGASISPALPTGLSGAYDATSGTYSINGTPTVAGTYSYTVTTTGTTLPCTEATAEGTIIVIDPDASPGVIAGPATVCAGETEITYSVEVVPMATSYNWSVPSGAVVTEGSGTNAIKVTFGSESGTISVTATTLCGITPSSTKEVTVNPVITPSVSITSSDPDNKICWGTGVTFTATTENTGGGTVTYAWIYNGVKYDTWNECTKWMDELEDGDVISCEITVTNATCVSPATVTSNEITTHVYQNEPGPSVTITSSDADNTICWGTGVTFTATTEHTGGGTVTYAWIYNDVKYDTWNESTKWMDELEDGDRLSCEITVTNAACFATATVYSNEIVTAVIPQVGVTIASDNDDNIICAGTSVTFTATPLNFTDGTLSYTWVKNGTIVGSDQDTYIATSLADGDEIICGVTVTGGSCPFTNPAPSNLITVTVNPLPTVSIIGGSQFACESTILTAATDAANPTFTWYRDDLLILAEEGPTLEVTQAGNYRIKVTETSTGCMNTSEAFTVSEVSQMPLNRSGKALEPDVCPGSEIIIVLIDSEAGVSYQLREGENINTGEPVLGNGDDILFYPGVFGVAPTFSVMASRGYCSIEMSDKPTVNILDDTQPTITSVTADPTIICIGSTTTLTVSGSLNGATEWMWYTSGCGVDGAFATGASITVSPSETTDYYVRGEGGCINPLDCGSVIVTVEATPIAGILTTSSGYETICEFDRVVPLVIAGPNGEMSGGNGKDVITYRTETVADGWSGWQYFGVINYWIETGGKTAIEIRTQRLADACEHSDYNTLIIPVVTQPVAGEITKSPDLGTICEGTQVSATFTEGSGGVDCTDIYAYRYDGTDGEWIEYTPGSTLSTAGHRLVEISTQRGGCQIGCQTATRTVSWIIDDITPPVVVTKDITVQLDADGKATILPSDVDGGSYDNCGIASRSLDIASFGCVDVGTPVTVKLTVTDAKGNSESNTAIVTVQDKIAPEITCAAGSPFIRESSAYSIYYIVSGNEFDAVAEDACGIASLTYSCLTASISSGTSLAGVQLSLGDNTITWTAIDANGNKSDCQTVVTVQKRPLVLTYTGDLTEQYSDEASLSAKLLDVTDNPVSGKAIKFTIGSQTVTAMTGSDGIAMATLILDQSPIPAYTVRAEFAGDASCMPASDEDPFDIAQENAVTAYTGNEFVGEQNPNVSTTPLVLSASVTDMDDGYRGDIRNAWVQFYDVNTLAPLSDWLTPGLVMPGDLTQGSVIHIWDAPVPASGYNTFTIGVKVGTQSPEDNGYYMGSDKAVVNVYRTDLYEFISGGGHIIPSMSKGEYASDSGRKVNFGFNVKWNKTMKRLQGNLNLVFRIGDKVYQIKANAMNSLSVNSVNPCSQQAYFTSKANLTDITMPGLPVEIKGNLNLQVAMTNNTSPGAVSSIGFTVYDGNTLCYSSSWPINQTEELPLAGGNIIVHNGITCVVNNEVDVMLYTSLNPSFVGHEVIFEAVVVPKGSTLVPEGTILFKDGTAELGIVSLINGKASLPVSDLSEGIHIVTAEYTSTNGFDDGLSNTVSQEVIAAVLELASDKNPSSEGETVTFTATITGPAGGIEPTGSVTFSEGATVLGTVPLAGGAASFPVIDLPAGDHTITAKYSGDANYGPLLAALTQTVNSNVSIALSSSRNPEQVKTTVTFTATVTASGTPVALADVSFYINGNLLITVATDGAGLAVIDYSFASTGTYLVEARWAGQSASLSQVIKNRVKPEAKSGTVAESQFELANMKVFPNPFDDHLKFEFTSPMPVHARIDIYDLTGRIIETVFDQQIEGGTVYHAEFKPVKEVSAMYLYRITLGNSSYVNKVVYKSRN